MTENWIQNLTDTSLVELDGRAGGGQILRTALTLAVITRRGFRLRHIRGKRERPGLMRQHLTAVRAAAAICAAQTVGAELKSTDLTFQPGQLCGGDYSFAVGSAGSANLVLQTVIPALMMAPEPSTVSVSGGTHNQSAPPFCFLAESWLPILRSMGAEVELTLTRWGFFPAGGGCIEARITPRALRPINLLQRGAIVSVHGTAASSQVNPKVGRRELRALGSGLKGAQESGGIAELPQLQMGEITVRDSPGPGNIVWLRIEAEHSTAVISAVGRKGRSAEQVAEDVVAETSTWLAANVPVEPHLADQLLLPMALAGGGRFCSLPLSAHGRTQATTLARFLPVRVHVQTLNEAGRVVVEVVKCDSSEPEKPAEY